MAESSFAAAHAFFHLCDAMAKSAGGHPALPDLVPKVMQTVAAAHPSGVMARLRSPSQPPLPLSEVDVAQVLKAAAVLARALPEAQTAEVAKASVPSFLMPCMRSAPRRPLLPASALRDCGGEERRDIPSLARRRYWSLLCRP